MFMLPFQLINTNKERRIYMTDYEAAREKYAALGVDTDIAIETLKKVPVSLHCWQLDDVIGFDNDGGLTGGIQTTGNYMGRAKRRNS